jgi:hypothetical protein
MARGSGDLAKFPQNENGKRFKGTLLQKKGGWRAKPPRRLFPFPPAERKREEALGGRSPPPRAKIKDDLSS